MEGDVVNVIIVMIVDGMIQISATTTGSSKIAMGNRYRWNAEKSIDEKSKEFAFIVPNRETDGAIAQ